MEKKIKLEVEIDEIKARELMNAIFGKNDFEFELKNKLTIFRLAVSKLARYEQLFKDKNCNDSEFLEELFYETEKAEQAIIDHVMTEVRN